jgi:uncharacterized caspase-like protein/WD40 repeat protein
MRTQVFSHPLDMIFSLDLLLRIRYLFFRMGLFGVALTCLLATSAHAYSPAPKMSNGGARKVALVIGNAAYSGIDALRNPVNDAELTAQSLRNLGFSVTLARNRNNQDLNRDIDEFGAAAKGADIALLYYAGHGTELDGNNYLIPVDQSPQGLNANALKSRGTSIKFVQSVLLGAQARVALLMVDACRNPPRGNAPTGFSAANSVSGVLQLYSTSPGTSALDGTGNHSVFASVLNRHLANTALSLKEVVEKTQHDVAIESNGRQTPWIVSGLVGDVNLVNSTPLSALAISGKVLPIQSQRGNGPSEQPILRIEPAVHIGPIWAVDTDASGRWAATAGDDKTVRVWDLQNNALERTLRPPIGTGFEGKLLAVGMTPDGRTIATAGVSGQEWDHTFSVYLFDRQSGVMRQRLTGFPRLISRMAFSPDGQWLAIALAGDYALYVWNLQDGGTPVIHGERNDANNALAWMPDGRLMTASRNGVLRLYSVENRVGVNFGKLLKTVTINNGNKDPRSLAFSPDGSQFAVGYFAGTHVDVIETASFTPRYSLDTGGLVNRFPASASGMNYGPMANVTALDHVSWSRDGTAIVAAGLWNMDGRFMARIWSGPQFSQVRDVAASSNSILAIKALARGGWVLASGDGTLGMLAQVRQENVPMHQSIADMRGSCCDGALQVNTSGSAVQFGFGIRGQDPVTFDVAQRHLQTGTLASGQTPLQQGLDITDWINSATPKLNGRPLSYQSQPGGERINALAIMPRKEGFVLGTDIALRFFDAKGKQLWQQAMPQTVWGVNIPSDGTLIIAALADGTIRWFRTSDGVELLALFVHADHQRWVLWTPSGYYDASAGADELLGWHVNRGAEQSADFFNVGQFRDTMLRPDVISQILVTKDEAHALGQANIAAERIGTARGMSELLPPVLDAVDVPASFNEHLQRIVVRARSNADAPVTRLRVLVNDAIVNVSGTGGISRDDGLQELWLNLPEKDSVIKILADNKNGTSQALVLALNWTGGTEKRQEAKSDASGHKPKLWLLSVGVSEFQNPAVPQLAYAQRDAQDWAKVMLAQQGKAYRAVEARVLTNASASKAALISGLDWLKDNVAPGDVAMVFLAGHGFTHAADNRYFFAGTDTDPQHLSDSALPYKVIQDTLIDINLRGDGTRSIVFIDTCHAGDAAGGKKNVRPSNGESLANELVRQENQVLVFASSRADQFSWEYPTMEHGAFTAALLEGVGTPWKADPYQVGRVTYKSLDAWLAFRVPLLTQERQTPRLLVPPGGLDDFSIAKKK